MMTNVELKQALYQHCLRFIDDRFKIIQNTINEIQESLTSETKSSAGDKHETGRSMLQLEREKAGNQLAEIKKTKEALSKIDVSKSFDRITIGSVILTSQNNYFIAISAGELRIDGRIFFAISPNTPIGQLLIGKKTGDVISFRTQTIVVEKVF